jgi:hypothetical protein
MRTRTRYTHASRTAAHELLSHFFPWHRVRQFAYLIRRKCRDTVQQSMRYLRAKTAYRTASEEVPPLRSAARLRSRARFSHEVYYSRLNITCRGHGITLAPLPPDRPANLISSGCLRGPRKEHHNSRNRD